MSGPVLQPASLADLQIMALCALYLEGSSSPYATAWLLGQGLQIMLRVAGIDTLGTSRSRSSRGTGYRSSSGVILCTRTRVRKSDVETRLLVRPPYFVTLPGTEVRGFTGLL